MVDDTSSPDNDERIAEAMAAYFARQPSDHEAIGKWLEDFEDVRPELERFLADQHFVDDYVAAEPLALDAQQTVNFAGDLSCGTSSQFPAAGCEEVIGDYEILEEIARGGMGVVYKARQRKLNRIVALKMVLANRLASETDKIRFRQEAEAAAQLDHPSIVKIFEVDQQGEVVFFSMSFVDGGSVREHWKGHCSDPRRAASLIATVAEAVHFAHSAGVIHRDIKPANILLDQHGQPQITDFGLAKFTAEGTELTTTGQILGTPAYMAPEQAWGQTDSVGPATDVYGLGATLYAMLVGHPPFVADQPLDVISQVRDQTPTSVRHVNREVPPDLDAIVMKCLSKSPEDRYATADELARDLHRFVAGDRVSVDSISFLGHVGRAISRSHNREHVRNWGWTLRRIGWIVLASYMVIFGMLQAGIEQGWMLALPRVGMMAALAFVIGYYRPTGLIPTNSPERVIWATWCGYFLAHASCQASFWLSDIDPLQLLPIAAGLAGLGFIVMGSHAWGGCYIIAAVFLFAGPVLGQLGNAATVLLGVIWWLSLQVLAWYYDRVMAEENAGETMGGR